MSNRFKDFVKKTEDRALMYKDAVLKQARALPTKIRNNALLLKNKFNGWKPFLYKGLEDASSFAFGAFLGSLFIINSGLFLPVLLVGFNVSVGLALGMGIYRQRESVRLKAAASPAPADNAELARQQLQSSTEELMKAAAGAALQVESPATDFKQAAESKAAAPEAKPESPSPAAPLPPTAS